MRRSILVRFAVLASGALSLPAAIPPAGAQEPALEPLLLRIRPPGETPRDLGVGSGAMTDDEVRQARARNEAVWARAERRARIAIASVCTGCLPPARPPAERPSAAAVEAAAPIPSPSAQTGAP